MSALTAEQMIAARAIYCIVAVKEQRIRKARAGNQDSAYVGIPWRRFLELVAAVEAVYPDVIAKTRELEAANR